MPLRRGPKLSRKAHLGKVAFQESLHPRGPGGEFADKPGTSQKILSAKDQRKADFASFQAKQKAQAAGDDPILAAAGLSRSNTLRYVGPGKDGFLDFELVLG